MGLTAVELTHVKYEEGDIVGSVMAWLSLFPVFVAFACFPTHFLFRRDLRTMFLCLGLLLGDVINHAVKYTIRQPRPPTCAALDSCRSYGMPSAHSQFMFFFATFVCLLSLNKLSFADPRWKAFTTFVSFPLAALVAYSRVYLGYHSLLQIIAGSCFGALLGAFWYVVFDKVAAPLFPAVSESTWGRYLCIKDDSHISNIAVFEYENSMRARKEARAKNE